MNAKQLEGEIVFYDRGFGFIKSNDQDSYYFNKKNLKDYAPKLLDRVSFQLEVAENGKYKNQCYATGLKKIGDRDLTKHSRLIGVVDSFFNKGCVIVSPQLKRKSLLFYNRFFEKDLKLKKGSLVIFSPVKSSKEDDIYFALFGYSFENEKDIPFLLQQLRETNHPEIEGLVSSLIKADVKAPLKLKFDFELSKIGDIDSLPQYLSLVSLIQNFKELKYEPDYDLLKNQVPDKYLIQLWENDLICSYDLEVMKGYFHNTSADNKRLLYPKFLEKDIGIIIDYHIERLIKVGKLEKLNNDIKTVLDITYRRNKGQGNNETREYRKLKSILLTKLNPEELVYLWSKKYIGQLPENIIAEYLNAFCLDTLPDLEVIKLPLKEVFEGFILDSVVANFQEQYPKILSYLRFCDRYFADEKESKKAGLDRLANHQKFFLWILNGKLEFDALSFFKDNYQELNDFYRLRFFLHDSFQKESEEIKDLHQKAKVTQQGLESFALTHKWDSYIVPVCRETVPENKCAFLLSTRLYVEKFDVNDINVNQLAILVFESIPKYQVHHIRLWLYGFVGDDYYNYIGFREEFRNLESEEQNDFRRRVNDTSLEIIAEAERTEVTPCLSMISQKEGYFTYRAFIENFYFGEGYLALRKEDGSFTEPYRKNKSMALSMGFNRIPKNSLLNRIEMRVEVSENNEIDKIEGLDELVESVRTGEIEKALGKVVDPVNLYQNSGDPYVEDWELRKKVIDFLHGLQFKSIEPTVVAEPKNPYERLRPGSKVDFYEKTILFSIETEDGFAIVWENIDLSPDKATFIFKTSLGNHLKQIEVVADAIVSYGQFRSTLVSSKEEDEALQIFKNNLGYVTSIRRARGKEDAFSIWSEKFEDAIKQPIPPLPSHSEVKELENWTPEVNHTPRTNKTNSNKVRRVNVKRIKEEDIQIFDMSFEAPKDKIQKKSAPEDLISGRLKILKVIQEFNQSFSGVLPIKNER